MADVIAVKEAERVKHPAGQFVARCVDVVDCGEKVESYAGQGEKLTHKCALVFRTGETHPETGEPLDISKEFTVSMGDKANLRKTLEQWRGRQYRPEEVAEGVPLHKLEGNWAIITVEHRTSGSGKVYANISAVVGVPPAMQKTLPELATYTRAEFWTKRKEEYAKEAASFRDKHAPKTKQVNDDFEEFPGALNDQEDDLPFN